MELRVLQAMIDLGGGAPERATALGIAGPVMNSFAKTGTSRQLG